MYKDRYIENYSKIIKFNLQFSEAYNNRSKCYYQNFVETLFGDMGRKNDYTKVIEINENFAEAYNSRCVYVSQDLIGSILIDLGRIRGSHHMDCTKALHINRNFAYFNLGRYYYHQLLGKA